MKAYPWILSIVVTSTLTHAAEDKPDTSRWVENFCDEAAFDSNWGAYGWLPDGKTSSRKEDRKLWWELVDGALRARTSPGVHPSGLTRKVEGTDVRVSCRFKLPPQGLVGVGFNCHRSLQNVPPAVESKCTTPGRWFSRLGGLPLARTARVFLKWDAATACLGCSP